MNATEFLRLATGFWPAAVLNAAAELDLFSRLESPRSAGELAEQAGVDPAYLASLLDALCGMGVVEKGTEGYRVDADLQAVLSGGLADSLRYNHDLYPLWGRLDQCIRTASPVTDGEGQLGGDTQRTERFVRGMEGRGRMMAPAVLGRLKLPQTGRLLDLACGSGVFSRGVRQSHPDLELHLYDLPGVLEVTKRIWKEQGVEREMEPHPGNYRRDPLPEGFDAVLYCGALHQESLEDAARLIRHAARSLLPGGRLQVVDFMLEEDRTQPLFSAFFSLNMMLLQPHGHVFTYEETAGICRAAGLTEISIRKADESCPYGIVSALRAV